MKLVTLLLTCAMMHGVRCVPLHGHGHGMSHENVTLFNNPTALELFHLADVNHDHNLTIAELHQTFLTFDINKDHIVREDEFLAMFLSRNLGTLLLGSTLFNNLDVNDDFMITEEIDLPFIMHFFDRDADGHVSELEFEVQWMKISLS
ncbi:hypothetical protein CHS0354_005631 [Potamilus streckersoni]|uniref:EF-hand domain-containing protein n=1 Tax=Potamilus streckersoni TaxID=2493646 RepID=A0AAE0SAL6_9BIVA|nr:hypothetical protein CHS0354_005631 [Potamilus streckersoni]